MPKKLFVFNVITLGVPGGQLSQRNSYDVTKDGQRFVLNRAAAAAADATIGSRITVVLNWAAALRKE